MFVLCVCVYVCLLARVMSRHVPTSPSHYTSSCFLIWTLVFSFEFLNSHFLSSDVVTGTWLYLTLKVGVCLSMCVCQWEREGQGEEWEGARFTIYSDKDQSRRLRCSAASHPSTHSHTRATLTAGRVESSLSLEWLTVQLAGTLIKPAVSWTGEGEVVVEGGGRRSSLCVTASRRHWPGYEEIPLQMNGRAMWGLGAVGADWGWTAARRGHGTGSVRPGWCRLHPSARWLPFRHEPTPEHHLGLPGEVSGVAGTVPEKLCFLTPLSFCRGGIPKRPRWCV